MVITTRSGKVLENPFMGKSEADGLAENIVEADWDHPVKAENSDEIIHDITPNC